jgi:hypothetical protein
MTDAPQWVSAKDAVGRIMRATDLGETASLDAIIAYVRTKHILAHTLVLTQDTHRQGASKDTIETQDVAVPLWFWGDFSTRGSAAFNCQSNVFSAIGFHDGKQMTVTLTGVRFDARGLDILDPAPRRARVDPPAPTGNTGRPTASWWEDLIIDIFGDVYWADLKPERQADIEAAMHDWISAKGLSASSSTVRKRARKLWDAIHREGEN